MTPDAEFPTLYVDEDKTLFGRVMMGANNFWKNRERKVLNTRISNKIYHDTKWLSSELLSFYHQKACKHLLTHTQVLPPQSCLCHTLTLSLSHTTYEGSSPALSACPGTERWQSLRDFPGMLWTPARLPSCYPSREQYEYWLQEMSTADWEDFLECGNKS